MRICVLGAGSLGCVFGGMLAEAGADVLLVNRNRALVDILNRDGLTLLAEDGPRVVEARAAVSTDGFEDADLAIVLVKSFHTRDVMAAAGAAIGPRTLVLSLQNGLGHEDIIAEFVDPGRILVGRSYVGGQLQPGGRVVAGSRGKKTYIGEPAGGLSERARLLAETFTAAGLETVASPAIMTEVWDKLLVNAATGPLSALTRLPYGELYASEALAECARAAVAEGMAVARAEGVALSIREPDEAWRRAGTGLPADFENSMLQSVRKGSRTEIDYVNGAIVARGQRRGVETPVNRALTAAMKGLERALELEARGRSGG